MSNKNHCYVGSENCRYPKETSATLGVCFLCNLPACKVCSKKRLISDSLEKKKRRVCINCWKEHEEKNNMVMKLDWNTRSDAPMNEEFTTLDDDIDENNDVTGGFVEAEDVVETEAETIEYENFFDVITNAYEQREDNIAAKAFLCAVACVRSDDTDHGTDMLKRLNKELEQVQMWIEEAKVGIEESLDQSGEFDDIKPLDFNQD